MASDDVTLLLAAVRNGEAAAPERLIEAVYDELRLMAESRMRALRPGSTLQPTVLVHEAYLRLVGNQDRLEDRCHFFGAAARAMERVIVDNYRRNRALKRGGGVRPYAIQDFELAASESDFNVVDVHGAISALEAESPDLAALVRFRYFVGLTLEQIAEVERVSLATVKRRWTYARAWLFEHLDS